MRLNLLLPSPLFSLELPVFQDKGIRLLIKREDLLHPQVSGNKWRKLKYNIQEAQAQGKSHLLTFGGAYSNHLYATAAAGKALGFATIGLVRGEAPQELNPTLLFARDNGMELIFLSRTDYQKKEAILATLGFDRPEIYILPEGGSNLLALPGCMEVATEILEQMPTAPDYVALCCGTGATAAGLIAGLADRSHVLGFSVLKGNFHESLINNLLNDFIDKYPEKLKTLPQNWAINTDYHFGGYARFQPELIEFINRYKTQHQIPLDPIYTGKLLFGLQDLIEKDYFPKGSTIVAIHTGGLQGIGGFNQRFGNLLV